MISLVISIAGAGLGDPAWNEMRQAIWRPNPEVHERVANDAVDGACRQTICHRVIVVMLPVAGSILSNPRPVPT